MIKKGRPKTINTRDGRKHTIILSVEAEIILREIKKQRPLFETSQYVSERIIQDFKTHKKFYVKHLIGRNNDEIIWLQKKNLELVNRYNELSIDELKNEDDINL